MSDLSQLGIAQASALLLARKMSAVELAQSLLARIREQDGRIRAFIRVDAEAVLFAARAADMEIGRGDWRGPLHGIPVAVKDNIDVAGMRTTCHSAILAQAPPASQDAVVIARLREAGAIVMGKTALHEFAIGGPAHDLPWPPARNPRDPRVHPGGSSSGSGAALAAGFVPAALGTDTSGSVRNPATSCGVVGMKPTYDLVSRAGVFPLAFSLDHVGPMARDAMDCALLLDAMLPAGDDPRGLHADAAERGLTQGIRGLRIGVLEHFHAEDDTADPRVVDGFRAAVKTLERLGASLSVARLPPLSVFNACCRVIQQAEQYAVHEPWLQARPGDYSELGRTKLLAGAFLPARDYVRALQVRAELRRRFDAVMRDYDALVLPSSLELPCAIDDEEQVARTYERHLRAPFSVTGTPAIAVPAGVTRDGLPMGVQLAGKAFDEPMLFRIAAALQKEQAAAITT